MCMCPILNGFRGEAMDFIARIKERQDALRRETRHVLTRVAKCVDIDGGVFAKCIIQGKL
jgi:hypothetical protein